MKQNEQLVRDIIVGSSKKYTIKDVPHLYEVEFQKTTEQNAASHKILETLQSILKRNKNKSSDLEKVLIGGFAAARPYILTTHIKHLLAFRILILLWQSWGSTLMMVMYPGLRKH